jgi:hypothetical protein
MNEWRERPVNYLQKAHDGIPVFFFLKIDNQVSWKQVNNCGIGKRNNRINFVVVTLTEY